ncbi:MAG: hypothetical protein ABIP94_21230 [Planctomycetota bacterium]
MTNNSPSRCALTLLATAFLTTLAAAQQTTCPLLGISDSGLTTSILWDINTTTAVPSNPRTVNATPNRPPLAIAFSPAGILYGVSQGSPGDVPPGAKLFTINPTSGAPVVVGTLTQILSVEGDIAVDPTTGILYAVTGIGDLFTINTSNAFCISVGNLPLDLPGGADYSGLDFDSTGQMYVWSTFGQVVRKVNKTNGAIQGTVAIAPSPGGSIGGLVFDPGTGTCFIGAGSTGPMFSKVNVNTGLVMPIGPLTGMSGIWALTFDPRNCAKANVQGKGCTNRFASFYEVLSATAQDLSGMKVTATFTGTGYTVTTGPGPGFSVPIGLPSLPLGDNTNMPAGSLGFYVGSNGWVARGPNNSNAPMPTITTFLNQPHAQVSAWTDLDPSAAGSGSVYYFEPAPGIGQATWDGVFGKGTTLPNSIQITWNTNTSDFSIEYGAISIANPQNWLTGYSPAGPNADPGPSDISTFGGSPLSIDLVDTLPLTLSAPGRPIQGATATPFSVTCTNIDSTAIIHLGMIGIGRPGLPLSGFGLPNDCFLHTTIDVTVGPHLFPGPIQTWTVLTLPALPPSFSGFVFNCQSATLTASGFGPTTRVSNGLKCVVGTL